MVVVGPYLNKELGNTLMELKTYYDIIIVGEHLSNLPCDCGIRHIDRVLATITPEEKEKFTPDLVIACGGAVLSRQLKKFLREAKNKQVWYVGEGEMAPDTFQGLAIHIPIPPESFFPQFIHMKCRKHLQKYIISSSKQNFRLILNINLTFESKIICQEPIFPAARRPNCPGQGPYLT